MLKREWVRKKKGAFVQQRYEPRQQNKPQNIAAASFWEHIKSTYTDATKFSMPARAFCSQIEKKEGRRNTYANTTHTHAHRLLKN